MTFFLFPSNPITHCIKAFFYSTSYFFKYSPQFSILYRLLFVFKQFVHWNIIFFVHGLIYQLLNHFFLLTVFKNIVGFVVFSVFLINFSFFLELFEQFFEFFDLIIFQLLILLQNQVEIFLLGSFLSINRSFGYHCCFHRRLHFQYKRY